MDSIANSMQNLVCPIMSQQPSSLSLNDVENLESEIMNISRTSSLPEMNRSTDNLSSNEAEPEAVIVEVEDIVEETASSLVPILEVKHTPVYQHQENGKIWYVDQLLSYYSLLQNKHNIVILLTVSQRPIVAYEFLLTFLKLSPCSVFLYIL